MSKPSGKSSLATSLPQEDTSADFAWFSGIPPFFFFFPGGRIRRRSLGYEKHKLIQTTLSEKRGRESGYSIQGSRGQEGKCKAQPPKNHFQESCQPHASIFVSPGLYGGCVHRFRSFPTCSLPRWLSAFTRMGGLGLPRPGFPALTNPSHRHGDNGKI